MRRPRPAPTDARIATSRSLLVLRASVRLARLAQAIRSTRPTAERRTYKRFAQLCPDDGFGKRIDRDAPSFIRIGILARDARSNGIHFSARLLDRHAGLEKRHCSEPVKVARHVLRLKRQRQIDLCKGTVENAAFGEDSDDDVRLAIQLNGSSDDASGLRRTVTSRANYSARLRDFSQADLHRAQTSGLEPHVLRRCRNRGRTCVLRETESGWRSGQRDRAARPRRHVFKDGVLALPVEEIESGDSISGVRLARWLLEHAHDSVRVRIRQRFKKHAVDKAEDSRVGADPYRERENRDDCESRAPPQSAGGIRKILPDRSHGLLKENTNPFECG